MNKNTKCLTIGAIAVALVAVTGLAYGTYAQTTGTASQTRWGKLQNLTDEQKTAMQEKMEARKAEMDTARNAVKDAMNQGYDAWAAAVKKYYGESTDILEEVTADNFAKYKEAVGYQTEAQTLQEKARAILQEIGINGRGMMGKGMGMGGRGMHGGPGF